MSASEELTLKEFLFSLALMTSLYAVEALCLYRVEHDILAALFIAVLLTVRATGIFYYITKNVEPVTFLRKVITIHSVIVFGALVLYILWLGHTELFAVYTLYYIGCMCSCYLRELGLVFIKLRGG